MKGEEYKRKEEAGELTDEEEEGEEDGEDEKKSNWKKTEQFLMKTDKQTNNYLCDSATRKVSWDALSDF